LYKLRKEILQTTVHKEKSDMMEIVLLVLVQSKTKIISIVVKSVQAQPLKIAKSVNLVFTITKKNALNVDKVV